VTTRLSVILTAFNGMPFLPSAVESVRNQSFSDFTLIIVDDGSTDGTEEYLRSLRDDRLKLIRQTNSGLGAARNTALSHCSSEYVAVMDQDDFSLPNRLSSQVAYLDAHRDVVAVGTQVEFMVGNSVQKAPSMPTMHEDIERRLLQGRAGVCHPSLMYRVTQAVAVGGYPVGVMGEDVTFCLKMAEHGRFANLSETHFRYRLHSGQASTSRNRDLIRANHYAAYCALCRRTNSPQPTLETFVGNASWMKQLRWFMEAEQLSQYRTARVRFAEGRRIEGSVRLAIAGLCQPLSAMRRVASMAIAYTKDRSKSDLRIAAS
jgi:glycosyltransferase involved in cell wall biosynthesis